MTERDLYDYALIEMNKVEAPSLLLEDFNYFVNKAVQQYINKVYNRYDINQQSSDDLRVLKATTVLNLNKEISGIIANKSRFVYDTNLPDDYMHILNCIVEYKVTKANFKCYNKNELVPFAARRLSTDMYTQILNNAYLRPMYKRPYYYISNVNTSNGAYSDSTGLTPTNNQMDSHVLQYNNGSTDLGSVGTPGHNYASDAYAPSNLVDAENTAGDRLANPSTVRLELRFGNDDSVFVPNKVYIDYLKAPMYIRLTQEQINSTLDYSQTLEFPDYVCFEIVNIFTRLLMENAGDPRLQTNMPINNTIINPVLQQQQAQAQQAQK